MTTFVNIDKDWDTWLVRMPSHDHPCPRPVKIGERIPDIKFKLLLNLFEASVRPWAESGSQRPWWGGQRDTHCKFTEHCGALASKIEKTNFRQGIMLFCQQINFNRKNCLIEIPTQQKTTWTIPFNAWKLGCVSDAIGVKIIFTAFSSNPH
jgi:hypothetical protein